MQDVEDVVLLGAPGAEAGGEVEGAVLLGDERVEDVCEELDGRGALGVCGREDEAELEDGVGVVACTGRAVRQSDCNYPVLEAAQERTDLGGRRRRRPRP